MTKTYREIHEEKIKCEINEILASVRQVLQLVKICASNSTSFEEFTQRLDDAIVKVEGKMTI